MIKFHVNFVKKRGYKIVLFVAIVKTQDFENFFKGILTL